MLLQSCNIRVDLPIPGSPPTKTREPFTKPPPKTLSSSPIPVLTLTASAPLTSFNSLGVTTFFSLTALLVLLDNFSS